VGEKGGAEKKAVRREAQVDLFSGFPWARGRGGGGGGGLGGGSFPPSPKERFCKIEKKKKTQAHGQEINSGGEKGKRGKEGPLTNVLSCEREKGGKGQRGGEGGKVRNSSCARGGKGGGKEFLLIFQGRKKDLAKTKTTIDTVGWEGGGGERKKEGAVIPKEKKQKRCQRYKYPPGRRKGWKKGLPIRYSLYQTWKKKKKSKGTDLDGREGAVFYSPVEERKGRGGTLQLETIQTVKKEKGAFSPKEIRKRGC